MNRLHDIEKDLNWAEVGRKAMALLPASLAGYRAGNLEALHFLRLLYIQRLYGLNEMELEDKIIDRPSYRRFAGLRNSDCPAYSRALWEFRRRLEESGMYETVTGGFARILSEVTRSRIPLRLAS